MRVFLYNYKYIIIVKLILLTLFTSEYIYNSFYPFVSFFIESFGNPWQYYIDNNLNIDDFPYQPLVLYFFALFTLPLSFLGVDNYYIVNLFFKFPLFLADIGIFILLLKVYKHDSAKVLFFYFFNPVIIYAIYILSLPEIIPVGLLFLSVFYLSNMKKSVYKSALVFGLTLATDFSFIIVLPLLSLYVYKVHSSYKFFFEYLAIVLIVLFFWDFPYLFSDGFMTMVLLNKMQLLFFNVYFPIGEMKLYLSLFAFSVVYYLFYIQKKVYYKSLMMYLGVLLTTAVVLMYPSPELYVWIIPFLSVFLIRQKNMSKSFFLYVSFSLFYLIFFIFFFKNGYNGILFANHLLDLKIENSEILSNAIYTILLILNTVVLFVFYHIGIKSKSKYLREQNLVIGIGGDSGSGKSLLLDDISLLLNQKLLKLEGDGEHKWERGDQNWKKYTHLDPKANFIYQQASIISQLKLNRSVYRSDYDHDTGKFTAPFKVKPKEFISISALHPFYLSYMRNRIDFKIYIDTDELLRRHWKIIRDVATRDYTSKKVIEQIETRVDDTKKYIYPQKKFADFVIKYYPLQKFSLGDKDAIINLGLQLTFSANIQIEKFLNIPGLELEWDYNDDLNTQHIDIKKEPDLDFEKLINEMIPNMHEIVAYDHIWLSGYRGLVQFFVILQISEIMKSE